MAERKLRAAEPGELRPTPLSITEAAEQGDELAMLKAMRARIATTIQDSKTLPRDLAALSLRLQGISQEIKALESSEGGDDITEATRVPDAVFDPAAI